MTLAVSPRPRHAAAAVVAALAALLGAAGAAAASQPSSAGISISALTPSHRLRFDARPDAVIRTRVRITNSADSRRTVAVWPTEIGTGATGGMVFPQHPSPAAGRWLSLDRSVVRVPAHGHRDILVRARVPAGVRAGERFAGIVATDRDALVQRQAAGVTLRTVVRLALPVALDLPTRGVRALRAGRAGFDIDALGTSVALDLRSTGSERIRRTRLDLRLVQGRRTVVRHRAQLADIFPATAFTYRIPWRETHPAKGDYRLVGTVAPDGASPVHVDLPLHFGSPQSRDLGESTDSAPIPGTGAPAWALALAAAASALTLAFAGAYLRLRRRSGTR